ncbi:redoxin domain-containing protein [Actinomadura barringtoniae]|uniref:thioredoxin-dependent peroxiredoxin n=1 Tax=Actinomadura barringtoniae TaxID=1427535 RepID=A0A939TA22_9ACTN|nr:redoxin domain-containing protein [Actinomadura barringtoniae]MBO2452017.1 redoxin domain-containing protein [Actinomadura barringtoniae]
MLEIGSSAPDITLEDTEGKTVRLSGYQGQGPVLIYFMRSATCPVCNRHVQDLVRSELDGVRVLIAVPADRQEAARWKAKRRVPFTVLVGRPHDEVGLARKVFGSMQQSGSILIDAQGIVRHAHGATMPTAGYDKKGITAAVQALRTGV